MVALRDQKRAGDLARGEAAERPQREGHLRLGGKRRMTAGEDELKPLIVEQRLFHRVLGGLGDLE